MLSFAALKIYHNSHIYSYTVKYQMCIIKNIWILHWAWFVSPSQPELSVLLNSTVLNGRVRYVFWVCWELKLPATQVTSMKVLQTTCTTVMSKKTSSWGNLLVIICLAFLIFMSVVIAERDREGRGKRGEGMQKRVQTRFEHRAPHCY